MRKLTILTVVVIVLLFFGSGANVYSQPNPEKKWSWVAPNWTPCEGFGMHGTYRANAVAQTRLSGNNLAINHIALWVHGAKIDKDNTTIGTKIDVLSNNNVVQTVNLARPSSPSVEPAPGPNESSRIYFPTGKTLSVPNQGKLRFTVSVIVKVEGGNCSLGTSTKEFNPFAST